MGNVFIIGKGKKSEITLPKEKGLYLTTLELKHEHETKAAKKTHK